MEQHLSIDAQVTTDLVSGQYVVLFVNGWPVYCTSAYKEQSVDQRVDQVANIVEVKMWNKRRMPNLNKWMQNQPPLGNVTRRDGPNSPGRL